MPGIGNRRRAARACRRLAALAAAVVATAGIVPLAAPPDAHAIAVVSTCSAFFWNDANAGSMYPTSITAGPLEDTSFGNFEGAESTGIAPRGAVVATATGNISVTGGCYVWAHLDWGGTPVECRFFDPSVGGNAYGCDPPASGLKVESDSDNLLVDFHFGQAPIYQEISAGAANTCAIDVGGSAVCWGDNADGQSRAPAGDFTWVSAGAHHACALSADHSVVCWGRNDRGQATPPPGSYTDVSAGGEHTCAIRRADGSIVCWGDNSHGQLSPPAGSFRRLTAGADHTCAISTLDGSVACWGDNAHGQSSVPAGSFGKVSAGGDHTCATKTIDGSIICWGDNSNGQSTPPVGGPFLVLSVGATHACAVARMGAIVCWGSNAAEQLSPPPGSFSDVSAGGAHTCAIRSSDYPVCWGADGSGQASPPHPQTGLGATSHAPPTLVRALLRRGDLTGRGWRAATTLRRSGHVGQILAAAKVPAGCHDTGKHGAPVAKAAAASSFVRGSALVGYTHGTYATAGDARRTLGDALSTHGIRCLARLLTSSRLHTHATFAHATLPGVRVSSMWRLVVRTSARHRTTRIDYVDVVGLVHGRSNALMIVADTKRPPRVATEVKAIRAVVGRLP